MAEAHPQFGKDPLGMNGIDQEGNDYPLTASISAQPQKPCYIKVEK